MIKFEKDIKVFITNSSKEYIQLPENSTMREMIKNLWRILAAEVWYSKSWI